MDEMVALVRSVSGAAEPALHDAAWATLDRGGLALSRSLTPFDDGGPLTASIEA